MQTTCLFALFLISCILCGNNNNPTRNRTRSLPQIQNEHSTQILNILKSSSNGDLKTRLRNNSVVKKLKRHQDLSQKHTLKTAEEETFTYDEKWGQQLLDQEFLHDYLARSGLLDVLTAFMKSYKQVYSDDIQDESGNASSMSLSLSSLNMAKKKISFEIQKKYQKHIKDDIKYYCKCKCLIGKRTKVFKLSLHLLTFKKTKNLVLKVLSMKEYYREVQVLNSLRHISSRYVPKIYAIGIPPQSEHFYEYDKKEDIGDLPSTLMEYIEGRSLYEAVSICSYKLDTKKIVAQMIYILHLLNEKRVVHRDIKPGNFMINEQQNLKIIDFGFAAQLKTLRDTMKSYLGTVGYMAPEIAANSRMSGGRRSYTYKCDWYSLGVSIWVVLTNCKFDCDIFKNCFMEITCQTKDEVAADLIFQLTRSNPETRLCSFEEIQQHLYFNDFDWTSIE